MITQSTRTLFSCCLLMLFVCAACSRTPPSAAPESNASPAASPAAQRITSEGVVKVAPQRVEITPGGSAEATVRMTIQSGYHVNANPPTFSYLKPTALEISPFDGVSVAFVTYPKGVDKK